MQLELPPLHHLSAAFVVGSRLASGRREWIGSVIVKGHYEIEGPDELGVSRLAPADAESEILFGDDADGGDVRRENDVAPFKPSADVVVEGLVGAAPADPIAELTVDATTWMRRTVPLIQGDREEQDRQRHLFGYQPRAEGTRGDEAGTTTVPAVPPGTNPQASLETLNGYDNRFLNFHRRGSGFDDGGVTSSIPATARIELSSSDDPATDLEPRLTLDLDVPRLRASYRVYCGRGPDAPTRWPAVDIDDMRLDSLILAPEDDRAEVLWRGAWLWDDQHIDRYRAIRIEEV